MSTARRSGRVRGDPPARDRGEAATQVVILVPVVLAIMTLAIQVALVFHAAHVAAAAAAEGAATGAARGATVGGASDAARTLVHELGAELADPVDVAMSSSVVRVEVTVRVASIVPFFPSEVTRAATEPKERITSEAER